MDGIVLELGAGSALASLVACKMGASHVCITDYPSTRIIDAIRKNVNCNLSDEERSTVAIIPLDWTDEEALKGMSLKYPDGFTRRVSSHCRQGQVLEFKSRADEVSCHGIESLQPIPCGWAI